MNVKKQNKITVPVAGSMNSNGTEQCRAFKQPLAGTVQKKLYKHKIWQESPGPWKVWPELIKFINMENLAQNTSYRICYMKELELCTAPVPPVLREMFLNVYKKALLF